MTLTHDDIQAEYEKAKAEYHEAASRLADAIPAWVARHVRDAYPEAITLRAGGEMGENGPILRAQFVVGAAGSVIAGWDDAASDYIEDDGEWEALTDIIDDLLDQLIDLTGDDYFGDQDIDVT